MADDFKYDVFISYSHKDEEWVVDTLLSALENAGSKVCIDFRDFIPGKPSRHNMRDACKESKLQIPALVQCTSTLIIVHIVRSCKWMAIMMIYDEVTETRKAGMNSIYFVFVNMTSLSTQI